jgi:two-component system NarL family sensor kinase
VEEVRLSPAIQLLIYHIAREAAMNALKHSGASAIEITLRKHDEKVELQIKDNGVGFDPSGPGPEGHFGLTMMRERAQVAGGTYDITSSPGNGTTVSVVFPDSWVQEDSEDDLDPEDPQDGTLVPVAEPSPSPQGVPA